MPEHFYIYPAYLDGAGPRRKGRRVASGSAATEVTVDSIVAAARGLGYTVEAEPAKQYPRQFDSYAGRVKVSKKPGVPKSRALREIAEELRRTGTVKGAG
jgi:signal recognition particle subunit SEC65